MFVRQWLGNLSTAAKVILACLLLLSPWLIVQIGIVILAPDKEITEMPSCPKDSANCAHLGGGQDYRLVDEYSTIINLTAEESYQNLIDYIEDNDWEVLVKESSNASYYLHFVEITQFWKFPDDVIVSIIDSDEGSIIEIHSESRLGLGDIGVNSDRIDVIYSTLVS